jgi:uncharacterized damage-inducible protein DinB
MLMEEKQGGVMVDRRRWFDREFTPGVPADQFPGIVERIRGTPARLEESTRSLPSAALIDRRDGAWSIQENVAHLLDLEPLWQGRLEDLLTAKPRLRPADLQNRAIHEGNHNERPLAEILTAFRAARLATVERLEALPEDALRRTSLHPRLEQPMTIIDLFHFVAEHDDHHLARITEIQRESR